MYFKTVYICYIIFYLILNKICYNFFYQEEWCKQDCLFSYIYGTIHSYYQLIKNMLVSMIFIFFFLPLYNIWIFHPEPCCQHSSIGASKCNHFAETRTRNGRLDMSDQNSIVCQGLFRSQVVHFCGILCKENTEWEKLQKHLLFKTVLICQIIYLCLTGYM